MSVLTNYQNTRSNKQPTSSSSRPTQLNLGSDGRLAGWVNVDMYNDCDVRADICDLPFADNSFGRVLASHVLEHVALVDVPQALREILRVCKPGGVIVLRTPENVYESDFARQISQHGSTDKPGYRHLWESNEALLLQLGWRAGLQLQRIEDPPDWPKATWPFRQIVLQSIKPSETVSISDVNCYTRHN